jgi:hypothetical protein
MGFVYIKVVVIAASQNCGKTVKMQVRSFINPKTAVGNAPIAVGKYLFQPRHKNPSFSLKVDL